MSLDFSLIDIVLFYYLAQTYCELWLSGLRVALPFTGMGTTGMVGKILR